MGTSFTVINEVQISLICNDRISLFVLNVGLLTSHDNENLKTNNHNNCCKQVLKFGEQ